MDNPANELQPAPGIELDIGNLACFDNRPPPSTSDLKSMAVPGVQSLVNAIFSLPTHTDDFGRYAELPPPITRLPREKPIPKERALTKWEQYAKEKGIQKKKRDRLVLDEATGEYVPRYGKGSRNALDKDVILPHKEGMGDKWNPFLEKKKEKKTRIKENRKRQASNLKRGMKRAGIQPLQALDVGQRRPSGNRYLPKQGIKDSFTVAQKSTASAGKFDKRVKGEKAPKRTSGKRKFEALGKGLAEEKGRSSKIADRVLMGRK